MDRPQQFESLTRRQALRLGVGACAGLLLLTNGEMPAFAGDLLPGHDADVLGLQPEHVAKDYTVQLIASDAPANVLWPGEHASFTLLFVNKTPLPFKSDGRIDIIEYGTRTPTSDAFNQETIKIRDLPPMPLRLDIPANGSATILIKPDIPAPFGAYALVCDFGTHGRRLAALCVRVPAATPGKVQFPTYAMDVRTGTREEMALFRRLGIKGTRMEIGYCPSTASDYAARMKDLTQTMALAAEHEITVLMTLTTANAPMPLGRARPFLDASGHFLNTLTDHAWLPEFDEDFEKWCKLVTATFGWPKGPVNAIELWNEPWEGLSVSGWGADLPRYRELYARVAQGVDAARREVGVTVLFGGTCSSMNAEDKLFCDGTDTFLPSFDFVSLHYQPLDAVPALIPEWLNRKSPYGPVRVWDTESWIANSEDRVVPFIASERAQGLERTAGVLHDRVRGIDTVPLPTGGPPATIVQALAPATAIAATQHFIGERKFDELLFQNGLPWVFVFGGLAGPDDGTIVVVGDLSGVYERDRLLFRTVGQRHEKTGADSQSKSAMLPAMTLSNSGGRFEAFDYYGNPLPTENGRIVIPLNVLGYFLRTDGSVGSFAALRAAMAAARIDGYQPIEIVAYDLTDRIAHKPTLRLKLTNILNRPVTGLLNVTLEGVKLDPPSQSLTLSAHETREIALHISGSAASANSYALAVHFDGGRDGLAVLQENLHVNLISRLTPTIDARLDDWKAALPHTVRDSGGTSANITEKAWLPFEKFDEKNGPGLATAYLAYDDEHFYFAAKIADNSPDAGTLRFATRDDDACFYPETSYDKDEALHWPVGVRRFTYRKNPELPSGSGFDNVQIAFGVIPPGKNDLLLNPPGVMPRFMVYKDTNYEFALNQVAEKYGGGTEIWRLLAPGVPRKHYFPRQPKAKVDGGPVANGRLAMRRDGNTRFVECALPWSEIPLVRARLDRGEKIKFSFRVNDNGGNSYELAGGRSVSKINNLAFHDYWTSSWANEVEFAFEKGAAG